MKSQSLTEEVEILTKALKSFGNSVEEATRAIEVLGKINNRATAILNRVHPFAKYFKQKRR